MHVNCSVPVVSSQFPKKLMDVVYSSHLATSDTRGRYHQLCASLLTGIAVCRYD